MSPRTIRVFVTAEDSLRRERDAAISAVSAVQKSVHDAIELQAVPLDDLAPGTIQEIRRGLGRQDIPDVVINILSSRLGPSRPRHPEPEVEPNGSDLRDARVDSAAKTTAKGLTPSLLIYRKTGNGIAIRSEVSASLKQKKAFNEFLDTWFGDADDSFEATFEAFITLEDLESLVRADLERLVRRHVPDLIEERAESGAAPTWSNGSPFPGADSFDQNLSDVFFGRRRAIGDVTRILINRAAQNRAFILVSGQSGCGKTSLIQAGVIPALTEPGVIEGVDLWRCCRFRPNEISAGNLFAELAARLLHSDVLPELAEGGVTEEELADLLREAPRRADIPLRMALRRAGEIVSGPAASKCVANVKLLLFVDQLEALIASDGLSKDDLGKFINVLAALAQSGHVWVVATVRSDHLGYCREVPAFAALMEGSGEYNLQPPNFAEYGQVIRGPARAAGLQFETDPESGERLDDILHKAAIGDEGALPLVQFVMHELHKRIRAEDRVVTFNAYRRLGGLEGMVARLAEDVVASLDPSLQAALPALLRALVTVSVVDSGKAESRTALMRDLRLTPERSKLLDTLIEARLINADENDKGESVARLACQGMLAHWPRAQEWLKEDQAFLRARATLINAARYWRQQGRNPDFLLSEGQSLAEHESLPDEWKEYLDTEAIEYVQASMSVAAERRAVQEAEEQRYSRRLTWIVAALVGVIAAASAVGGYLSYHLYLKWGL